MLVLIHHSVIAYTYYGHTDRQSFLGFDGVVLFNDSFFMSAMFFLSGLFVWPSLQRKGTGWFLRDRWWRLGLPFIICALIPNRLLRRRAAPASRRQLHSVLVADGHSRPLAERTRLLSGCWRSMPAAVVRAALRLVEAIGRLRLRFARPGTALDRIDHRLCAGGAHWRLAPRFPVAIQPHSAHLCISRGRRHGAVPLTKVCRS
jgi:hypothetical protein